MDIKKIVEENSDNVAVICVATTLTFIAFGVGFFLLASCITKEVKKSAVDFYNSILY